MPSRSLGLAASLAADAVTGLAAMPVEVRESRVTLAELKAHLGAGDGQLLLCLRGRGTTGLARLDAQLLAALIEVQTTGRVLADPADPRPATGVDAAMAVPVVNDTVARLVATLAEGPARSWALSMACAERVDGPDAVGLVLEDVPYRFLGVDLDLGAGAKTGQLELAFPETRRRIPPGERRAVWQSAFGKSLKEARVSLRAVLCRQRISLSALAAMAPGETLGLPRSVLASVALETIEGRRVAEARLGRSDGFRAIRLNAAASVPPGVAPAGKDHAAHDPLPPEGPGNQGARGAPGSGGPPPAGAGA